MLDQGFIIEVFVNFYQTELADNSKLYVASQASHSYIGQLKIEKPKEKLQMKQNTLSDADWSELVLRIFLIFEGIMEFIKLRTGEVTPTTDQIVKVTFSNLTNPCFNIRVIFNHMLWSCCWNQHILMLLSCNQLQSNTLKLASKPRRWFCNWCLRDTFIGWF